MVDARPRVLMIAGPNGAGKTTFARAFLPNEGQCKRFINADLIAAGLSPFEPERVALQAGRLMLDEIARAVADRESFAVETTLSGLGYLRQIKAWRAAGYRVSLYFLSLPSPELAIARVKLRVQQGGHNIPEPVIRRRFAAGLHNLMEHYRFVVDGWALYSTGGIEPILQDGGGEL
ncbi:zeta toxin family protein [Elstera sp.]|uniref:zeta toxin family protein n=1 Tax=Elstera sp. TaxID=1916664 RepID=UPI0037C18357